PSSFSPPGREGVYRMQKIHSTFTSPKMRQVIDRSFGMLTRRFGIFWRPFSFVLRHWHTVVRVCCKLHNLCVERDVPVPELSTEENELLQMGTVNWRASTTREGNCLRYAPETETT